MGGSAADGLATRGCFGLFALAGLFAVGLSGCPDPDARFDDFLGRTTCRDHESGTACARDIVDAGVQNLNRQDLTGTYIIALATDLDPGKPLVFKAAVTVDTVAWTFQFVLTPLHSRCGARPCTESDPEFRAELDGDIVSQVVEIDEDGRFEIDFGTVGVPGLANAISGSDIQAQLMLFARTRSAEEFCGNFSGALIQPFDYPLNRSTCTFGVVRVSDTPDAAEIKAATTRTVCSAASEGEADAGPSGE